MKRLILVLALILPPTLASAQEFTEPIKYTWIATSCENWDCAAAAFAVSAGDRNTIILPTNSEARPWLILRRVEEGSVYIPEDEPFTCQVFQQMTDAIDRYESLERCKSPLVMNMADGQVTVTSMGRCETVARRRAAGH